MGFLKQSIHVARRRPWASPAPPSESAIPGGWEAAPAPSSSARILTWIRMGPCHLLFLTRPFTGHHVSVHLCRALPSAPGPSARTGTRAACAVRGGPLVDAGRATASVGKRASLHPWGAARWDPDPTSAGAGQGFGSPQRPSALSSLFALPEQSADGPVRRLRAGGPFRSGPDARPPALLGPQFLECWETHSVLC